jgi:APA family basic amino acid/polyamine antiporter
MAIAVVVGNVIGAGIFLKPGNIASYTGSFSLIMGIWIAAGALCILGAMCFAELAAMRPKAGGIYVYLYDAYGRLAAFLYGWTELLLLRPASIGALSVAFASSLALSLGWPSEPAIELTICAVLILGMGAVNVVGVIWGGRLQLAVTIIKAGFLLLVASAPWVAQFVGAWTPAVAESPLTAPIHTSLAAQISAILLAVMWAYDGWNGITPLAEEVRDPQRNLPLALLAGIGILIVLYVSANLAYHRVLSLDEMRAAGDHAAEQMLFRLAGPAGQSAMSIVIMCSTFGAINSSLLMAPRITFAMGRDRLFFRIFGDVHATFRTPVIAILATSLMAISLIALTGLGKFLVADYQVRDGSGVLMDKIVVSLQNDSIFALMTNFFTFSASIFYALAVLAVIVLRYRHPEWERPFRVWAYPLAPLIFVGVYAWFLSQAYQSNPLEARIGIGFMVLGVPVYYLLQAFLPERN